MKTSSFDADTISVTNLSVSSIAWCCGFLLVISFLLLAGCSNEQEDVQLKPGTEQIVAKTGPILAVRVGETPVLDGSRSFTSFSGPMGYSWSFAHKPDGSKAVLNGKNSANPGFVADISGVYSLQLVVSARGIQSKRALQIVIVTAAGERLTGPTNHPGLSSDCVSCHDGSLVDPGKTPDHIASSDMCQACHTPQSAAIIPFVDHQEVFGSCSGCHDGVTAIGKSEFHTPTTAECDNCHNTTSFLTLGPDGKFDHSDITRLCSGCHNGTVAIGKTATALAGGTHPDTKSECNSCHTTDSFLNAYPDHTGPDVVGNRCDACHGISDTDLPSDPPVGHPVTFVDCDVCHNITSFNLGGIFSHHVVDASVQPCASCHNDDNSINAIGKSAAVPAHIVTSADCGSCHNTEGFTPAFAFDHTGRVDNCQLCHGNNSPDTANGEVTASGKPPATASYAHMPTSPDNPGTASDQDCGDCHTPGAFDTGTYDHAGVVDGCNACHDNRISIGKLINHIPTSPADQDCADCHNSTVDFLDVSFSHAGIIDNCDACHDGDIATGKPADHIPTAQDCIICHTTADTFLSALNFSHFDITDNCESCHNGSAAYVTAGAIGKPVDHIPAPANCSTCHEDTATDGFSVTTLFLSSVHPLYENGCEGCHSSSFISNVDALKSDTHLPTLQDCHICHLNTAFLPHIFDHSGITGGCSTCHDGSSGNVSAGAAGKTADHPVTTAECNQCHNTSDFSGLVFDHTGRVDNCAECHGDGAVGAVTKKDIGHVVTSQDCSLCHVPGTFKEAVFDHTGITDNCASCHDGAGAVATIKHAAHITTAEDCSVCHNTTAFAGARYDHTGIIDNCRSCHDGTTASGKPEPHVPTSDDCSVCHQTTGFTPATFDHTGIVDNCSSCHDGSIATGKTDTHITTTQDCAVCHTTASFVGAVFDHTGIVDNCSSCHDGDTAKGKDAKAEPPHLTTTLDCHHCHTTATFAGGSWVHDDSSIGRCDECHNDTVGATAKPSDHISTTVQCDVCHSTTGWAPDIFSHDPLGDYPGDHRRDPGCTACHGSTISEVIPWPFSQYEPHCAACHANDFERKGDHNGGENGTVEQNKNCAASGCHRVGSSEF